MNMSLSDIRKDGTILNNYELSSVIVDGQCKSDKVMNGVIEIITNQAYKKSFVGILGKPIFHTRFHEILEDLVERLGNNVTWSRRFPYSWSWESNNGLSEITLEGLALKTTALA